jgi:hypothetical protein
MRIVAIPTGGVFGMSRRRILPVHIIVAIGTTGRYGRLQTVIRMLIAHVVASDTTLLGMHGGVELHPVDEKVITDHIDITVALHTVLVFHGDGRAISRKDQHQTEEWYKLSDVNLHGSSPC